MIKHLLATLGLFIFPQISLYAQDLRERTYYYEILEPKHTMKPKVNGFASDRIKENLNRGLLASLSEDGKAIYLNWRLLDTDPENITFNIYRLSDGKTKRLNTKPIAQTCDFIDKNPVSKSSYWIIPVIDKKEYSASEKLDISFEDLKETNFLSIKLRNNNIRAGKIAVADLNGDGAYDYIIRTPDSGVDPGKGGDLNRTTYQIEAYLNDGTYLWTKDLGQGIEPGIWYSPFIAYDFNGDGKAEIAIKTAPDNIERNEKGRIDSGEEYLSILDGMTGNEIDRVHWPERNDRYGDYNRQNRNQIGLAFLDGKTPYILAVRGTYKLMVVDAWMLNDNKLEHAWRWDGDEENPVVRSMGAHNMICADIDDDGRDEIILGSCAVDDNGTLLWSTGLGHPDRIYLTDIDPHHPGMELFLGLEPYHENGRGVCLVNPKDGTPIWNIGHPTYHIGDAMVADIDSLHSGLECFACEDNSGGSAIDKYLLTAEGETIADGHNAPPCRTWVWWDADLLRELIKSSGPRKSTLDEKQQNSIGKWNGNSITTIEGDIIMIADLIGDWREEIITTLPGELRIYHTNILAKDRRTTLMQDPLYRNYVTHRSMGYPQSPVPSYYLGE